MRNSPLLTLKVTIAALLIIPLSLATAQTASAQGFLESIFGAFTPKKQHSRVKIRQRPALVRRPSQAYDTRRINPFSRSQQRSHYSPRPRSRRGRYKTLCVRVCDGYYFPISNATPRRQLYEAAQQCQSRCNSETRLFYMSPNSSSVKTARDMEGRSYSKLRNAFVYRKKLVKSCSCRAKPWSVAERIRHRSYATVKPSQDLALADTGIAKDETPQETASVELDQVPQPVETTEPLPVVQPQPVLRYQRRALAPPPRRAVRRSTNRRRHVSRQRARRPRRRARRVRQKSWGLGGSGLAPAKQRQRWPGDPS